MLITGFIGGNSISTTGDTAIGIVRQLFEKGEVVTRPHIRKKTVLTGVRYGWYALSPYEK